MIPLTKEADKSHYVNLVLNFSLLKVKRNAWNLRFKFKELYW